MPRTEKSVTFLTGMIIAALYVIMLVGFSRESYMRRDAELLSDPWRNFVAVEDASNRMCRVDRLTCAPASQWRVRPARPATFADVSSDH